jgi:hypothetical protein
MIAASEAWRSGNLSSFRELLLNYEQETIEEDLRGPEWYYLKAELSDNKPADSYLQVAKVDSLAFPPNNEQCLGVGLGNGAIVMIDLQKEGAVQRILESQGEEDESLRISPVAFSPTGHRFAAASAKPIVSNGEPGPGNVHLYEWPSRKKLACIAHDAAVASLAWIPIIADKPNVS